MTGAAGLVVVALVVTTQRSAALVAPAPLRLLTFDLDDTFWPTGPVVARANEVLFAALAREGADGSALQDRMKALRRAAGGNAMSYTAARTGAVAALLSEAGRDEALAPALFDEWLSARHAAAEALLFEGAAEALAATRRRYPEAVVGAVTNGRGDPRAMPSLEPFFAFVVSGEDDGVHPHRKPAPRIFEAALARGPGDAAGGGGWVHVGDDLLNDCSAAKAVGAKTVWFDAAPPSHESNAYSTLSDADRAARKALFDAVDPAVAADARISGLADLPAAVARALER